MRYPVVRAFLFLSLLCPLAYWLYLGWTFALGPDPGKALLLNLGEGALILLLATLSMSPLQKLTGWAGWIVVRRQVGLWAFAYAGLHLLSYLFFVLGFEWAQLGVELRRRPYILVGMLALILLLPLAATSNRFSMRRLGKRWKALHRLVYPVLGLALLHMLWIVRSDAGEWALYASIAVLLMLMRWSPIAQRLSMLRGHRRAKSKKSAI